MEMTLIKTKMISSSSREPRNGEDFKLKCSHVLAELVDTERIYVTELGSIITGYKMEMNNKTIAHLVPQVLLDKVDILFGNLEDIYLFHCETFLKDLENCISNTQLVALCFVQRVCLFSNFKQQYRF
jgi:hypothetical protein